MSDDIFQDINEFLRQDHDKITVLEDHEIDQIILAFAVGRGDEGFYEDELNTLLQWAVHTRVNNAILDLAIKGLVMLNTEEKTAGTLLDVNGENLTVQITEAGKKHTNLFDN